MERAARSVGVPARECILIGDSLANIYTAKNAGRASSGMLNRLSKVGELQAARADLVVDALKEICSVLR